MSHQDKFLKLLAKKKKLIAQEEKLIGQRKQAIGNLALQFGLLAAPDKLIAGLFFEAQSAIFQQSSKVQEWEVQGARFCQSKKSNTKTANANNKSNL